MVFGFKLVGVKSDSRFKHGFLVLKMVLGFEMVLGFKNGFWFEFESFSSVEKPKKKVPYLKCPQTAPCTRKASSD